MCQEAHIKNAYTTELLLTGILRQVIDLKEYPFDKACLPPGECVRANRVREQRKKQLDWLATNTDDITTQSHSFFACSREKHR